jgi:TRAP-type mannitol/chloroaromatic compound transport system permease small subunit
MSYETNTDLDTPSPMPVPGSAFGWWVDGLNSVGSAIIFAIMFLIVADVLARDLLNSPIHGVAEMVSMSIIVIMFLQLGSTLRHGRMSRADIFLDSFKVRRPQAGAWLQAFFHLCGALVCAVIVYATWPVFMKAWNGSEFIGVQGVFTMPTWPVRLLVMIGAATTTLQYLVLTLSEFKGGRA